MHPNRSPTQHLQGCAGQQSGSLGPQQQPHNPPAVTVPAGWTLPLDQLLMLLHSRAPSSLPRQNAHLPIRNKFTAPQKNLVRGIC